MNWQKTKQLNEQRAQLKTDLQGILKKAEDEKRDLTADESGKFDELRAKADALSAQIEREQAVQAIDNAVRAVTQPGLEVSRSGFVEEKREFDGFAAKDLAKYSLLRAIRLQADRKPLDGVEKEVSDELAKRNGKSPQGFYFPTEVPTGAQVEQRTGVLNLTTGSGAKATILDVANFVELLRNRVVVQSMGARVLTGLTGDLALPKQTGGSTAYWVAESGAPIASNQTVGQVTFAPKTVGAYTDLSRKFILQSSLSAEAFAREDIAKVLAIELDRAAVNGSGASNQPTGILQQGGVSSVALGTNGGTPTWANIVTMETDLAAANADLGDMGYLTNAKVRGLLKGTLQNATAGARYIWENTDNPLVGQVNGYKAMVTNNMPSTLTKGTAAGICSAAIFGNWNDLIMAFWSQLDILVDPYTGSTAGTVRIVAMQDCDINVRHAESFTICTDILA